MHTCFLSYNDSYRPAMEWVRRLLEALDFDVYVFDGPDQRPTIEVVHTEIHKAHCIVVLLAPEFDKPGRDNVAARWPAEEAVFAQAIGKPLALLVHSNTEIPYTLKNLQTPARFDFTDPVSFVDNTHNVIRHLLDTKRLLELPGGESSYYFSHASFRFRIDWSGTSVQEAVYHEVVAREPWETMHHALDTGSDLSPSARIAMLKSEAVKAEVILGAKNHTLRVEMLSGDQHSLPYLVHIDPPLPAGGRIGYRRLFFLENFFPLNRAELRERSDEAGFPEYFRQDGKLYYGQNYEVQSEIELLEASYSFPSNVPVASYRAVAIAGKSQEANISETKRINLPEALTIDHDKVTGDTTLGLAVRSPIVGHNYLLLYEPGR